MLIADDLDSAEETYNHIVERVKDGLASRWSSQELHPIRILVKALNSTDLDDDPKIRVIFNKCSRRPEAITRYWSVSLRRVRPD